jgi:hypothetical protein
MAKTKIIFLRIIVFILVFAGVVFAIIYFMSANTFYDVHDTVTNIRVWLDTNQNGKRENSETFLPSVCVWGGYASEFQDMGGWQYFCSHPYFETDSNGLWSEFFAGGSCPEIYNVINPPENYFPTTPTIVNGCLAEFGLSQEKPKVEIKSQDVGQYLEKESQKEITIFRVKTGIIVLFIFVFASFVSFKTIRPVKTKPA